MAATVSFIIGLICATGSVSAQLVTLGNCPQVSTQENFDLTRYLGKWYENRRYTNFFSLFSNCVTAEYVQTSETSVQVNNTGWKYLSDFYDNAIGEAVVQGEGKLGVRFSEFAPYGDYWVLKTDYTSYTIVWSCAETPEGPIQFNSQFLWILTRSPEGIPEEKMAEVLDLLTSYNIDINPKRLKPTKQSECPGRQFGIAM